MASLSGTGGANNLLPVNTLHPLDLTILTVFLLATLIVGMSYGRRVKTIRDYALGGSNFSTYTLVATIVATFASGSVFFIHVENIYIKGLYHIIPWLGLGLQLWLQGHLVMRMGELLKCISIAEAMGSMYGKTVQIITALSSILARVGYMAIQFKIIARVIVILLNFDSRLATITAAGIVIAYSAFGGIKSVTFTDVLQFITFSVVLPILALVIWRHMKEPTQLLATLADNPNFNIRQVFSWNTKSLAMLSMFIYCSIPTLQPELFQRMAMAGDVRQARKMLTYSAGGLLLVYLVSYWIGVLLLADNPHMAKTEVVAYMVSTYTSPGILGLLGIGIIAMAMSTADSSLNAMSVMFANDIVKPLTGKTHGLVRIARTFSVTVGFFALFLALYNQDILSLVLISVSFYMPIFAIPLLMAVVGFRTSKRAVLMSMVAGGSTVILCKVFFPAVNAVVTGMGGNLLMLLSSHYLLGERGGWQKLAPDSPLALERAARREAWKKRKEALKSFRLYPYLQQLLPVKEGTYTLFGIYAIAATYLALYTIGEAEIEAYKGVYEGIYGTVLWIIAVFIIYPVWPPLIRRQRFMAFFWPLGMAAILFFTGTLLVILSHFHHLQVFVLLMNFFLVTLLTRWPMALSLAISGVGAALWFFGWYTGLALPMGDIGPLEFRLLYTLLVFIPFLFAFFAYQKSYRLLGEKNEALQHRDKDRQASLVQVSAEKQATLAALQHTGVGGLLTITRDLQALPVREEGKALLESLQNRLLPIAFHLQGIDTKSQDYLRLEIADLALHSWCNELREVATQKGVTARIYCNHNTKCEHITCDPRRLTQLVVDSMVALHAQLEKEEDTPPVLLRIEDTSLSYPLPDVAKSYIKNVPAVRLAITVGDDLPVVRGSYSPNLGGANPMASITAQELARLAGSRIIKSHYGYTEVTDDALIYVIPVDVSEVRPRDMDKAYMEVDATPKRSDDHYKSDTVDAQAQEVAFLADVSARSEAGLDKIKMALELIKWYHGPSERKSGEPFYLHPLSVAQIVLDYNQDEATIIGALLHDTVEDTPMLLEHIEALFGKDTAGVVDLVTHLQSIPHSIYKVKMSASENLQMLERTGNKRGLYVKLADRMHNMRTINGHSKVSKRKLIARETMDFFVPLARKLGLQEAAQEFEKMCSEVLR